GPSWVVLRVSSSGAAVDPERVEELFESFSRGGVNRTAHSGTRLGLAIVRAVVKAHRGTVSAEAVPGGGLTVTVHLPAAH
ncbi:MAG: ATP-binding protein, partial [Actinomycetota bacterium]|nr:ATP-binding protein [Actinomycetota bacterium]